MSSLIELAAKRLDELRKAGVKIPGEVTVDEPAYVAVAPPAGPSHLPRSLPTAALVQEPARRPDPASVPVAARQTPASAERKAPAAAPARRPSPPKQHIDIDLERLQALGYLVPKQSQSLLVDLMRVIKRPILQNLQRTPESGGPERRGNIVVVTSAVPGEGKTFVATNLAMSIAMEVDHSAILIDGDVLRPSVFKRLGLTRQAGLMDVLLNAKLTASDLLVETNVPKLSLMCAGSTHARSEEVLASAAMDNFLDDLSSRYPDRVIVIDSPPLLATTESRALAERAGQVILVVEANRTPREQVQQAFEALEPCPIVMSVLNKARVNELDYAYGY